MRILILLGVMFFLLNCSSDKTVLGNWKKCVSPSLGKLISTAAKDSLENADFFALRYFFRKDSTLVISNNKNVSQTGTFSLSKDSLLVLKTLNKKKSELFVLKSTQLDSLILFSDNGSITYLIRE